MSARCICGLLLLHLFVQTSFAITCAPAVSYATQVANVDEIEDGLFLSMAPRDPKQLEDFNLDVVIKTAMEYESPKYEGDYSFEVRTFAFRDVKEAAPYETIKEAVVQLTKLRALGRRVLVHCGQGVSRSATVVALYLMAKHDLSWEQAVTRVAERRPIIKPNLDLATPATREKIVIEAKAQLPRASMGEWEGSGVH